MRYLNSPVLPVLSLLGCLACALPASAQSTNVSVSMSANGVTDAHSDNEFGPSSASASIPFHPPVTFSLGSANASSAVGVMKAYAYANNGPGEGISFDVSAGYFDTITTTGGTGTYVFGINPTGTGSVLSNSGYGLLTTSVTTTINGTITTSTYRRQFYQNFDFVVQNDAPITLSNLAPGTVISVSGSMEITGDALGPGGATTLDFAHTIHDYITPQTPGASFTSAGGGAYLAADVSTPEPGAFAMAAIWGGAGLAAMARRRRKP